MSRPLPQGEEKARAVRGLFDTISGRYDLVNRVMTFGMDVGWRRRAIRELRLPAGALVAEGSLVRLIVSIGAPVETATPTAEPTRTPLETLAPTPSRFDFVPRSARRTLRLGAERSLRYRRAGPPFVVTKTSRSPSRS